MRNSPEHFLRVDLYRIRTGEYAKNGEGNNGSFLIPSGKDKIIVVSETTPLEMVTLFRKDGKLPTMKDIIAVRRFFWSSHERVILPVWEIESVRVKLYTG